MISNVSLGVSEETYIIFSHLRNLFNDFLPSNLSIVIFSSLKGFIVIIAIIFTFIPKGNEAKKFHYFFVNQKVPPFLSFLTLF